MAFSRISSEVIIQRTPSDADGIRPDGSFGQHAGILYDGNYGKDYTNDVLDLELQAADTRYELPEDGEGRKAVERSVEGDEWMIVRNGQEKADGVGSALHWDMVSLASSWLY